MYNEHNKTSYKPDDSLTPKKVMFCIGCLLNKIKNWEGRLRLGLEIGVASGKASFLHEYCFPFCVYRATCAVVRETDGSKFSGSIAGINESLDFELKVFTA